jgi:hypothetical protein
MVMLTTALKRRAAETLAKHDDASRRVRLSATDEIALAIVADIGRARLRRSPWYDPEYGELRGHLLELGERRILVNR